MNRLVQKDTLEATAWSATHTRFSPRMDSLSPYLQMLQFFLMFQYSVTFFSFAFCFCLGSKLGFLPKELMNKQASMTGGLVGQSEHLILPSVPPLVTMILTLLSLMVRNLLLTSKILILQDYVVRGGGALKVSYGRLQPKSPTLYPLIYRFWLLSSSEAFFYPPGYCRFYLDTLREPLRRGDIREL